MYILSRKYFFEFLVLIILILMYWNDFPKWFSEWIDLESFYAFGLFIIGFLIYLFRKHFDNLRSLQSAPCYAGLIFLLLGILAYVIGKRCEVYYLISISLPLFLYGIILQFYGKEVFKKTFFPLVLFAFTLPIFPLHRLTSPLMIISTEISSQVLLFLGIPSFAEGNLLHIMDKQLSIAAGCSGIKSLFSLFFLSIIYSYFTNTKSWKKIAVVLISLPFAFLMNILRITLVGLYVLHNGYKYSLEFHDYAGIFLLAVSVGIMVLTFRNLEDDKEYADK